METYNTAISKVIKWQYNQAPNLQNLFQLKEQWYRTYHWQYWDLFHSNIFNLNTVSKFGCMVWCLILGVPAKLFFLGNEIEAWGFTDQRQNFIRDPSNPPPDNPNLIGGNFIGGSGEEIIPFDSIVKMLRLRYVALIANGNVRFINRMLRSIFNDDAPWDYENKNYFYLATSETTHNPAAAYSMTYRIGGNTNIANEAVTIMRDLQYGFLPRLAGVPLHVEYDEDS